MSENLSFGAVQMSVSMPEALSWHMILDHELSQLTLPEAGVFGSVGFMFLGAVLGLIPGFVTAVEKVGVVAKDGQPAPIISGADLATVAAFCACFAAALVCLVVFCIRRYRNSGLASTIRARTRRGFAFSESANAET